MPSESTNATRVNAKAVRRIRCVGTTSTAPIPSSGTKMIEVSSHELLIEANSPIIEKSPNPEDNENDHGPAGRQGEDVVADATRLTLARQVPPNEGQPCGAIDQTVHAAIVESQTA